MLTDKEMLAAHFARQLDLSPNYAVAGVKRARAWSREHADPDLAPRQQDADEALYRLGKEVLSRYTLSYSARFQVVPPDIPDDVVGAILIDAGYIATSPACRLAMFVVR